MKKIIIGIGILFIIVGVIAVFLLSTMSYNEFLDFIIQMTNIQESKRTKLTKYITNSSFQITQFLPLSISLFGALIIVYATALNHTSKKIGAWASRLKLFFTTLPKFEKYLVLMIIIGYAVYNIFNAIRLPISYDEAYTYLYFTKRSIFSSVSYYPLPNNHIFHSILTNLTFNFPFSKLTNLRIPNLGASFLVTVSLFYTFSKLLNKRIALLLLPLFCFLFPCIWYSCFSRGYMLQLLAFVICFYATLRLTHFRKENQSDVTYFRYLSIAAIMGFYTIPSFLYPFFTCVSYIFGYYIINKLYSKTPRLILFCSITTIVVLLLYTPVFIISGINAVVGNKFVIPISRFEVLDRLYRHFNISSQYLFELPMIVILLFLLLTSILLIKKKRHSIIFSLYCFLIMPFILLAHSVVAVPRTWIYITIPLLYALGLTIKSFELDKKMSNWSLVIIQVGITCILILSFNYRVFENKDFSHSAVELADYLIENNAQHVYSNHPLVSTNLLFIFEEREKEIKITYAPKLIDPAELELIKSCCDYIISGNRPLPEHGFTFIKNWNNFIYLGKIE